MMLAAAPKQSQALEIFELSLTMLSQPQAILPESLKTYLMSVIEQAKILSNNPQSALATSNDLLPEAITLALYMQSKENLADDINGIGDFDSINKDVADRVLNNLEFNAAF